MSRFAGKQNSKGVFELKQVAKKKATTKTVFEQAASAKRVTKKAVAKKANILYKLTDDAVWVVSERKFLTWEPYMVYPTKARAEEVRKNLEKLYPYSVKGFKVSRATYSE